MALYDATSGSERWDRHDLSIYSSRARPPRARAPAIRWKKVARPTRWVYAPRVTALPRSNRRGTAAVSARRRRSQRLKQAKQQWPLFVRPGNSTAARGVRVLGRDLPSTASAFPLDKAGREREIPSATSSPCEPFLAARARTRACHQHRLRVSPSEPSCTRPIEMGRRRAGQAASRRTRTG